MSVCAELTQVTKRLGASDVIHDMSLTLPMGECAALIGHNGAGKTTIMKLMLGLAHPTSGTIRVFDQAPAAARTRGLIGFLPENVAFSQALTGEELLAFYARLKGLASSGAKLLERVGLGEASRRPVRTYSKGMRQRLGLAQALIGSPRFLLFDEPTTALDAALKDSFRGILCELRERGVTVLLSSHVLTEIEGHTDRLVILRNGRIIAEGPIEALQAEAKLPIRIWLSTSEAPDLQQPPAWLRLVQHWKADGRTLELFVARRDKVAVLGAILQAGLSIEDIEISPPSLDQLYAHFAHGRSVAP